MSPARNTEYRDLRAHDEPHHALSVKATDSFMGHTDEETSSEKTWSDERSVRSLRVRSSRLRRVFSAMMSLRSLLDSVLLVVILLLVLDRKWGVQRLAQYEGNGDITGFAPRMSQQIISFSPDPGFAPENASEFFTDAVQKKWLSIVPKGLGYVKVEHPEQYENLPAPLEAYSPTTFTTSMTHQLHCLHAILSVYSGMASNNTDKMSHDGHWHLSHCFEYLRQSIMCCGDTALEGQQTTFPPGFVGSDGWDAKHVCKDYSQVKGYLEERRQNDAEWI